MAHEKHIVTGQPLAQSDPRATTGDAQHACCVGFESLRTALRQNPGLLIRLILRQIAHE
jgi:hypothetical protein